MLYRIPAQTKGECFMYILGIDFETTGLDPNVDRVTEVGAAVWNTDTGTIDCVYSALVNPGEGTQLSDKITELTGITSDALRVFGQAPNAVFSELACLMEACDYMCAHNAPFDRSFYEAEAVRYGIRTKPSKWIDTRTDVEYYGSPTSRKLVHLAAEHGIVNTMAHRAIFDVMTMLNLLRKYNIRDIIETMSQPVVTLKCVVSFDDRDKAKSLGYYWNPERRSWLKQVRQSKVPKELAESEAIGVKVEEVI